MGIIVRENVSMYMVVPTVGGSQGMALQGRNNASRVVEAGAASAADAGRSGSGETPKRYAGQALLQFCQRTSLRLRGGHGGRLRAARRRHCGRRCTVCGRPASQRLQCGRGRQHGRLRHRCSRLSHWCQGGATVAGQQFHQLRVLLLLSKVQCRCAGSICHVRGGTLVQQSLHAISGERVRCNEVPLLGQRYSAGVAQLPQPLAAASPQSRSHLHQGDVNGRLPQGHHKWQLSSRGPLIGVGALSQQGLAAGRQRQQKGTGSWRLRGVGGRKRCHREWH
jgi:hypothetical protein